MTTSNTTPASSGSPLDASDFPHLWETITHGATRAHGQILAEAMNTTILRDAILSETARTQTWDTLEHAAVVAARTANTHHTPVAGPMTLHALAATITGDTPTAVVLLDIVLAENPDYTLALLTNRAIHADLPGHVIAAIFADIPLTECLHTQPTN